VNQAMERLGAKRQICSLAIPGRYFLPWQGENTVPITKTDHWFLAGRILLFATRMIMVNALNSLSSGLGSSPGWKYYISLTLTFPLSAQV